MKHFLIILLTAVSGIVAVSLFTRPNQAPQDSTDTDVVVQQAVVDVGKATTNTFSQSENGIEVIITDLIQLEDSTVIKLTLDNHQYDLNQETIYEGALLDGAPVQSFTILSKASGGHHVEVELVFRAREAGAFVITPVAGTTFTFDDLWK
ncbi:MAG: hypothetical protein WC654_01505 [Patescibacteria group bacterium]